MTSTVRIGLHLTSIVSLFAAVAVAQGADLAPGLIGEYFQLASEATDFPTLAATQKPILVHIDGHRR